MYSRLSTWSRFSALLGLLFHLSLVAVGPVFDARLELAAHAADHAPLHVEDADDPACDPGHPHRLCLIQALHSMDPPPEGAVVALSLALTLRSSLFGPVLAPPFAASVSALGARAPPSV